MMGRGRFAVLSGLLCCGLFACTAGASAEGLHAWVTLGGGYDNNVNRVPDESAISLPDVAGHAGTFTTTTDHGYFGSAGLGLLWSNPVSPHWQAMAGGRVQGQHYYGVDGDRSPGSDIRSRVYFGMRGDYDKHRVGLTALLGNRYRHGGTYDNSGSLYGYYAYLLSPTRRLRTFVLYRRYDYKFDTQGEWPADMYDTEMFSGGVSLTQKLFANQLVMEGGLYVGKSRKLHHDAPDYIAGNLVGLYAKGTWHWNRRLQTRITLRGSRFKHDGHGAYFPDSAREDKRATAELGLRYRLGGGFSINPKYTYVHNDSTIPTRDYDRQIVSLELKKLLF